MAASRKLHGERAQISNATLRAVERDRWIGYPAGDASLSRLNELFLMRPRVRMPCLLLYGVSGAGKSMLLEKFKRDNAPKRNKSDGHRPIIATQMPPVPVVRSLYGEIVRTLGGNVRPTARFYELEHEAITLLTHAHPKLLIIDEIQHLLSCSSREQRAALNMVKYISNELRMSVIASRFEQIELPIWTETDELRRFVAGFLAMLPVKKNPNAIDQIFVQYLLALTDGVTGRIIDVLRRAALDAIATNAKSVGIDQLLMAGATLPAIVNQHV
jgi:Bacterial TniB protein